MIVNGEGGRSGDAVEDQAGEYEEECGEEDEVAAAGQLGGHGEPVGSAGRGLGRPGRCMHGRGSRWVHHMWG